MPAYPLTSYYDYDMEFPHKNKGSKIDQTFGVYHVYTDEANNLVIELINHTPADLACFAENVAYEAKRGYNSAESELFSPISENGLDFITADMIGALSEAPCFAEFVYMPDWISTIRYEAAKIRYNWKDSGIPFHVYDPTYTLADYWAIDFENSRIWVFGDYQITSPVDVLAETGKVIFTLA